MKKKYSFLRETLKGTTKQILWILVLTMITSKLNVYIPMFIQYALDGVVMQQENVIPTWITCLFYQDSAISKLLILALVLVALNTIAFILKYIRSKISTKFNLRINRNVKYTILNHLSKMKYSSFSEINHADVIQRVNNDALIYADFFNSQLNLFLDTIFIVGFSVVQIFELNQACGVFVFMICFCIVLLSIWYYKASIHLVEETMEANKQIIEKTRNAVTNSKMQKAFNLKRNEIADFKKVNEAYRKTELKLGKYRVVYGIGTHSIRNFKEPIILLFGGILVVQGQMSLAVVSVLLSYANKISEYIYDTVDKLKDLNQFLVSYRKLAHLMEVKEEEQNKEDKKLQGNIVLENVSVKLGGNTILQNMSLEIKQGENIAIIGDNGAGKTILAKTLLGFYEYEGNIWIGETNLKEVSSKSIRDYVGLVLQDTYLFHDTIRENLRITDSELSECEMLEALKAADMYQDIERFEDKLDTVLESGGENLSGGQKQRMAIARNILSDHAFIILDDSLSKLDTRTKLNILENMIALNKGVLMISHDIQVVKACSRVIFIHENHAKMNTHTYFMENSESYRQMLEIKQNTILEEEGEYV